MRRDSDSSYENDDGNDYNKTTSYCSSSGSNSYYASDGDFIPEEIEEEKAYLHHIESRLRKECLSKDATSKENKKLLNEMRNNIKGNIKKIDEEWKRKNCKKRKQLSLVWKNEFLY